MLKLDPHIHSEYSKDCLTKIDNIIKKSIERKIDIIGISDHDTIEGSKKAIKKNKNDELIIVPSIEISTEKGHILGFGCEDEIKKGLSNEETIDLIHENCGIAIIPHPYCFYRNGLLCKENKETMKFDAIEVKNARFILGYCNRKAKKLSIKKNIPELGSSDAHYHEFIGDCYTEIDTETDIDSILKSIKKGKTIAKGKGTSNIELSKYLINKNILKR